MKVFLSSTAQDLVAYRRVADDTILRLSQQAVVMERFGPLPGEPAAECERKARESDVVVCIVAHRYGFVPEKGKGSITRREVEAAKAAQRDVLAWIVDDAHPWTEKKEQDRLADPTVLADPARIAAVAEDVRALGDFKAWLRETFVVESFTTPDDLGRKIGIALAARGQSGAPNATPPPKRGEIRVVHALQPAPHFRGRDALVHELTAWVADLASPDRVWSLVAAGGTGKTAVVERVVRDMHPGEANVLVWSFYEKPDADAFLRECNQLFLGEEEGPAGGRLERLERGLRDGRPHLVVLDGLERVQEEGSRGLVRGELSDQTLKLLLRALSAGLGRARALVTSRFPLVDLGDWAGVGYRETRLDDLSPEAAVAVFRAWQVAGDDAALRAAAAQVGNHALSVAVVGSYLRSFADGRLEAVEGFDLDTVTGDDPKAAKLARVLGFYAERLPVEERDLLARLSVFPQGVTTPLLEVLVDARGEVAGSLTDAKPWLGALLKRLKSRGLVFEYRDGAGSAAASTWSAHPFLRERFRELLDCAPERVFDVVSSSLGAGLERQPSTKPSDPRTLDRYERLIEATRLAGREQDAFDLYWFGIGGHKQLGWRLGDYQREYRILSAFGDTGRPEDLGRGLKADDRLLLANALAISASRLGRLTEAWCIRQASNRWLDSARDHMSASTTLRNTSELALLLGRLVDARDLADSALRYARSANNRWERHAAHAFRGMAFHTLGWVSAADGEFTAARQLARHTLVSVAACFRARQLLDLGSYTAARELCISGLKAASRGEWAEETPWFVALLARVALASRSDPTPHIAQVREWTAHSGDVQYIVEAHLLSARHLCAAGDLQNALGEAEAGLLHAASCGYRLLQVELLVILGRIYVAWPDPHRALRAAQQAHDLASAYGCGYAWGAADAAHVRGEAHAANHDPALACEAFRRALQARLRIGHPGARETRERLFRLEQQLRRQLRA